MKVVEFIEKLNKLGFTNDTELAFVFLNGAQGEFYECEIGSIDDEERKAGYDDIIVEFNKPSDYIKSEVECANITLRERLMEVIDNCL